MKRYTTKPADDATEEKLFDNWFDPVEAGLRAKVRTFRDASFVTFRDAIFHSVADFRSVFSSDWTDFVRASFSGRANFGDVTFSGLSDFSGATFAREANFGGVTFSRDADFRKVTFSEQSNFVNAVMKDTTSFNGAIFKTEPPKFFGAELHQGTVWRGITWPLPPKDKERAGHFIDAYACLKLEMDRLKKHEDELVFFALEMQSRRVLLGPWRGLPMAIYGAFSDFGRSYLRPLVALFYLALICTLAFLLSDSLSPWQSLGQRKRRLDAKIVKMKEKVPPRKSKTTIQTPSGN